MNTLALVAVSVCVLALAYRYYAAFVAAKVLVLEPKRPTPAHQFRDGRDYHPTNKIVLFGHHFAAIAGAGPLIGPVLAAQYGWGPGALWILVGAVFAGAIQDMLILWASVRQRGEGLGQIAKEHIGPVSGWATGVAILFIMVVALAGLGVVVINALKGSAWGTFTIAATIPIAILMGQWLYKWRPGDVTGASIMGVTLLFAALFGGSWVAQSPYAHWFTYSDKALCVALPAYGFIAAILPVWFLLCPRDYLSTYMKLGVVALLAVGIVFVHPTMKMPVVNAQYLNGGGPIFSGPVWPYVCLIIMCGAISGFHALISSGTTPKMISSERELKAISYGGMLMEAFVAMLALIAACSLNSADYFHINIDPRTYHAAAYNAQALVNQFGPAFHAKDLGHLSRMVGEQVGGRPGGGVTLAVGMASVFAKLPFMDRLMAFWYHFAIVFEAMFILTTIDTGTRVSRFIIQELMGALYKPAGRTHWMPGILFASGAISLGWGYLVYNNGISVIWPMFGVANQLLGVLSLAIGTTLLLRYAPKRRYALIPFLPLCFLSVTVITAGLMNTQGYIAKGQTVPAALTIMMLALVAVVLVDSIRCWVGLVRVPRRGPVPALGHEIVAEATA